MISSGSTARHAGICASKPDARKPVRKCPGDDTHREAGRSRAGSTHHDQVAVDLRFNMIELLIQLIPHHARTGHQRVVHLRCGGENLVDGRTSRTIAVVGCGRLVRRSEFAAFIGVCALQ